MKKALLTVLAGFTLIHAVSIEQFKTKNAARYHNYGVTMQAKIGPIDCTKMLGYGKKAKKACFVVAKYKRKGKTDDTIFLYFPPVYQPKLVQVHQTGRYGFIACQYTHKTKRFKECSIK